ncbi:AhpC-TSA-domain-containing protein [Annulohypoxylon truncatum]|uniref:AhpC-TSA-domain-containing protein n=1 Tax=Annulohypoxylon truncatum TaxID=327061 RepID=UPI002007E520|nr:AhpC-TSA-domain-containing protein [Annulohypoxylon truncatum]KAI1208691.1 AhpC-TSA-domain-containing protein [Annulohypoxylon truncatum]
MPVELRKRKAPAPAPEPPTKKQTKVSKVAAKVKETVKGKPAKSAKPADANGSSKAAKPVVGDIVALDGFGGEIETNDGKKTTLKALVDESKSGVVIFTYPKASTPGCTTQACLFRDSYEPLTKGGLAIYGLSSDSPKANTTFKTKQNLPYPLLCDPSATLIGAIGLKKAPKGTTRGVFAIDKTGKVLLAEPGGPAATVDAVKKLVAESKGDDAAKEEPAEEKPAEKAADEAKSTNGEATEDKKVDGADE